MPFAPVGGRLSALHLDGVVTDDAAARELLCHASGSAVLDVETDRLEVAAVTRILVSVNPGGPAQTTTPARAGVWGGRTSGSDRSFR